MQIIEMYEPDEDLKKKGNKSEKKRVFFIWQKQEYMQHITVVFPHVLSYIV